MAASMKPEHGQPITVRFVVLVHRLPGNDHFDLMIEQAGALATWQIFEPPECADEGGLRCRRIADHRLAYLDYEGPISGNRGDVKRHDRGTCSLLSQATDRWEIDFSSTRLRGRYELVQSNSSSSEWSFRRRST